MSCQLNLIRVTFFLFTLFFTYEINAFGTTNIIVINETDSKMKCTAVLDDGNFISDDTSINNTDSAELSQNGGKYTFSAFNDKIFRYFYGPKGTITCTNGDGFEFLFYFDKADDDLQSTFTSSYIALGANKANFDSTYYFNAGKALFYTYNLVHIFTATGKVQTVDFKISQVTPKFAAGELVETSTSS